MVLGRKEPPACVHNTSRREFLAGFIKAAALLTASGLALGCSRSEYSRAPENPADVGKYQYSLSSEQLGFIKGRTTVGAAISRMKTLGITHIALNTNVLPSRGILTALSADFQQYIHLFRDQNYEQSVQLAFKAGEYPFRYELRVAVFGNINIILALERDYSGAGPTRFALIPYSNGQVGARIYFDLRDIERRNGGLQYPLLVGYNLKEEGITFIARDRNGIPWKNGYIMTLDGNRLSGKPVRFEKLIRCSCVHDWAKGHD